MKFLSCFKGLATALTILFVALLELGCSSSPTGPPPPVTPTPTPAPTFAVKLTAVGCVGSSSAGITAEWTVPAGRIGAGYISTWVLDGVALPPVVNPPDPQATKPAIRDTMVPKAPGTYRVDVSYDGVPPLGSDTIMFKSCG